MTVKELIKELQRMPQDALVLSYSELDECDAQIHEVKLRNYPDIYTDDYTSEPIMQTPFYCQGDSHAEGYWSAKGFDNPIVFLYGDCRYDIYDE